VVSYFRSNANPEVAADWVFPLLNAREKVTTLACPFVGPIIDWVSENAADVTDHCLTALSLFKDKFRPRDLVLESLNLDEERRARIVCEIEEINVPKRKPVIILEYEKGTFIFIPSHKPSVRFCLEHDQFTDQLLMELIEASIDHARADHFLLIVEYTVKNSLSLDILNRSDLSEFGFSEVIPLFRGSFDCSAVMKCENVNQLIGILKFKETIESFHVIDHAKKKDTQSVFASCL
jgi:hypothetical protein